MYFLFDVKESPIYTDLLNTLFSIPQNQCYPGTPCQMIAKSNLEEKHFRQRKDKKYYQIWFEWMRNDHMVI